MQIAGVSDGETSPSECSVQFDIPARDYARIHTDHCAALHAENGSPPTSRVFVQRSACAIFRTPIAVAVGSTLSSSPSHVRAGALALSRCGVQCFGCVRECVHLTLCHERTTYMVAVVLHASASPLGNASLECCQT